MATHFYISTLANLLVFVIPISKRISLAHPSRSTSRRFDLSFEVTYLVNSLKALLAVDYIIVTPMNLNVYPIPTHQLAHESVIFLK